MAHVERLARNNLRYTLRLAPSAGTHSRSMQSSPMVTCPWCGTHYSAFQPNCRNCGGPLPAPLEPRPVDEPTAGPPALPEPPPPPRPISDSYALRLLAADGVGIVAGVFLFIGSVFASLGLILVAGIVTAPVGLPFALIGVVFGGGGGFFLRQRFLEKRRIVEVLRHGVAVPGEITDTRLNASVTVNGRHPWDIDYVFRVDGQQQQGSVSTLSPPGPHLQPGSAVYVLAMPRHPEDNALYPHP